VKSAAIAQHCPLCQQFSQIDIADGQEVCCPHCTGRWGKIETLENIFDRCPFCECRQFYLSKDFNQFLGCLIMLLGIVFVPWTYGLSLPVFAVVDWALYQRIPTIVNCYRCGCEFRNLKYPKDFKAFMHHIGLKYDKDRK
jgi:hypothetical protein